MIRRFLKVPSGLRLMSTEAANARVNPSDSTSSSLQKIKDHEKVIAKSRERTMPVVYDFSGVTYALPQYMVQKRLKLLMWNCFAGSILAGFVAFVYNYSIWAVKQDDITDEFLDTAEQKAKAV